LRYFICNWWGKIVGREARKSKANRIGKLVADLHK
jgi:hypothetical protein